MLIAREGELVYRRAADLADREARLPMREDAIFRYASLTKPIVAAAALALIEQGQLRLEDAVSRWLPDFRPKTPQGDDALITARQLLTHTAGLTYGCFQTLDGPYATAGISDGLSEPGLMMSAQLKRLSSPKG